MTASLPTDAAARKAAPMAQGLLFYFAGALAEVARLSKIGNDQHNPGQPLHWAFDKSNDHADCIMRHLADAGTLDTDGVRHSAKVAWRALAMLQAELIAEGAPLPRNVVRSAASPRSSERIPVSHLIDSLHCDASGAPFADFTRDRDATGA